MALFEPTCLAPMGRAHHDAVKSQRLMALNTSLRKLSNSAASALVFLNHTNGLDNDEVRIFRSYIDATIEIVSARAVDINHDIKIISSCNYKWLMIQPMVVEDDLNNYNAFMVSTYLHVSRDIANVCDKIEEYVDLFEKTILSMQSRSNHCSWYSTILNYIYTWVPYWCRQ
jgi:hypothetical protein